MFEAGLGLNAGIVCIQKSVLGKKNLTYARFNLYWPARAHDCKDNRVLIAIQKDLLNKTIIQNWIDLVSDPYAIMLDIIKAQIHRRSQKKRTRIVNIYANKLGKEQT